MKYDKIPKEERRNILLLSDDIRSNSGIGTISKELVLQIAHRYNIIQVGAAINHPEKGKIADISNDINKYLNIDDAYVRIYPYDGYGDPEFIRYIINAENIHGILHYTDPRFWEWLYNMGHELRQHMPLMYYNVWDCPPPPRWNYSFYRSSDLIMNISRQTHALVKDVIGEDNYFDRVQNSHSKEFNFRNKQILDYVPHGINSNTYYPIDKNAKGLKDFENKLFDGNKYDFIVLYNNRNIYRKNPSDVIASFKIFTDLLSKEEKDRVALVMHTNMIDRNGTDLNAVRNEMAPSTNIYFSDNKFSQNQLNYLYNVVDLTINIASNEGFGLTTAESIMAGTPVLANVTGGLQDQMGFVKEDNTFLTVKDYTDGFYTNSTKKYKNHGQWVYPIFPAIRTINGSVKTPYIYDEKAEVHDVAKQLLKAYNDNKQNYLSMNGLEGREYLINQGFHVENMGNKFIENIDFTFENWQPISRFRTFKIK